MKNILLLLSALIVVPAWAGDAASEPTASSPATKQDAPKHKKKKAAKHKAKQTESTAANKSILSCPTGCALVHCPTPAGPVVCCKNNIAC